MFEIRERKEKTKTKLKMNDPVSTINEEILSNIGVKVRKTFFTNSGVMNWKLQNKYIDMQNLPQFGKWKCCRQSTVNTRRPARGKMCRSLATQTVDPKLSYMSWSDPMTRSPTQRLPPTPTLHMSHQQKSKGKFTSTSTLRHLCSRAICVDRAHPMRGGRTCETLISSVWCPIFTFTNFMKWLLNKILKQNFKPFKWVDKMYYSTDFKPFKWDDKMKWGWRSTSHFLVLSNAGQSH